MEVYCPQSGNFLTHKQSVSYQIEKLDESWWNLYDSLWVVISEMHGKGPTCESQRRASSEGLGLLARLGNDMFTARLVKF